MTGTIKVKIEGLNSGKIINGLVSEGVFIKNLKEKKKNITFEIDADKELVLKKVCKKFHKNYDILSKNSIVNLVLKLRFCLGFVLAISIVSAFIFSYNLYVFKVNLKVSSNQNFDTSGIEALLKENNIVSGMRKKDIDINEIQRRIILSQENVAGCTVKQVGGKLDIVIYPGILKPEKETKNVYSKFNAVISKIDIFAGKSNLKVGDIVKVGDLLIENDNGASGEILGKVYYSDYIIYNENQLKKERTGNQVTKSFIRIFGKNIGKTKKFNDFSNYFEENCVFSISKNTFIPINFVKTTYSEFEYVDEIIEFEKVENELKEQLFNQVIAKVNDKSQIQNITYSVVKEKNLTRLDCFIECEIDLTK